MARGDAVLTTMSPAAIYAIKTWSIASAIHGIDNLRIAAVCAL